MTSAGDDDSISDAPDYDAADVDDDAADDNSQASDYYDDGELSNDDKCGGCWAQVCMLWGHVRSCCRQAVGSGAVGGGDDDDAADVDFDQYQNCSHVWMHNDVRLLLRARRRQHNQLGGASVGCLPINNHTEVITARSQ